MDKEQAALDIFLATTSSSSCYVYFAYLTPKEIKRVEKEREWIAKRYRELRYETSFIDAEKQAVCEWIENYLTKKGVLNE